MRVPARSTVLAVTLLSAVAAVAVAGGCAGSPPEPAPAAADLSAPAVSSTELAATSAAEIHRVFPVVGEASYAQTHHGYPGSDIMAPCGARYVAPAPGVILETNRVDQHDPAVNAGAFRGGLSVSLLGDDGVRYYGSHFQAIEDAIVPGARVHAGDAIAIVGRTGDASACHVHFGPSPQCQGAGDWWIRRGVVWPWPYLDSWRSGGNADPRAEVAQWQAANGCPDRPLVEP
jgi:murein DD-endopeptidase MepM/ murein hydrolase activator NlpD